MNFARHFGLLAILWAGLFLPVTARAVERWQQWVTFERFEALALELAPRVGLFAAIWQIDPDAQLYGGTSRDFLWFLRGKLAAAKSEAELVTILEELRRGEIDARSFVAPQSDVDVIGKGELSYAVSFDEEFLTRIEVVMPAWFQPDTPEFEQEKAQGGCAVEKIRLAKGKFVDPVDADLAGGVREIYNGVPTLVAKDSIRATPMFLRHENHPVLAALRYLRQVAVAYFQRYGKGFPNEANLEALLDAKSASAAREVFQALRREPQSLQPFVNNALFRKRLNKLLRKIFRSHTNPTAAKRLFQIFAVDEVLTPFQPNEVEPYHTVAYALPRNPVRLAAIDSDPKYVGWIRPFGEYAREQQLALETTDGGISVVPTLHGTPDPSAYRSIATVGAVASQSGSAGPGVYVTDVRHRKFAENWREGERGKDVPPLVAKIRIRADARFLDLTAGPAATAEGAIDEAKITALAEQLDADIVKYPYTGTAAYVVRNGAVIADCRGDSLPLRTFAETSALFAANVNDLATVQSVLIADPSLATRLPDLLVGWNPEVVGAAIGFALERQPNGVRRHWVTLQRALETHYDEETIRSMYQQWLPVFRELIEEAPTANYSESSSSSFGGLIFFHGLNDATPLEGGEASEWTRLLLKAAKYIDLFDVLRGSQALSSSSHRIIHGNLEGVLRESRQHVADRLTAFEKMPPSNVDLERFRWFSPYWAVATRHRSFDVGAAPSTLTLMSELAGLQHMQDEVERYRRDSPFSSYRRWLSTDHGNTSSSKHLDLVRRAAGALVDSPSRWPDGPVVFSKLFVAKTEPWRNVAGAILQELALVERWETHQWQWAERILLHLSPHLVPELNLPRESPAEKSARAAQMKEWIARPLFADVHALPTETLRSLAATFGFDSAATLAAKDRSSPVKSLPADPTTAEFLQFYGYESFVDLSQFRDVSNFAPVIGSQLQRDPRWRTLPVARRNEIARALLLLFPGNAAVARVAASLFPEGLSPALRLNYLKLALAERVGVPGKKSDDEKHRWQLAKFESLTAFLAVFGPVPEMLAIAESRDLFVRFEWLSAALRSAGELRWPEGPGRIREVFEQAKAHFGSHSEARHRRVQMLCAMPESCHRSSDWAGMLAEGDPTLVREILSTTHPLPSFVWTELLLGIVRRDRAMAFFEASPQVIWQTGLRLTQQLQAEPNFRRELELALKSIPHAAPGTYHPLVVAALRALAGTVSPDGPSLFDALPLNCYSIMARAGRIALMYSLIPLSLPVLNTDFNAGNGDGQ